MDLCDTEEVGTYDIACDQIFWAMSMVYMLMSSKCEADSSRYKNVVRKGYSKLTRNRTAMQKQPVLLAKQLYLPARAFLRLL